METIQQKTEILDALNKRYATKKYDITKKISAEDLNTLKESIRLTPTSVGLQAFQVIDVRSGELREKLKAASFGQTPVTDASHFFVFCINADLNEKDVDELMQLVAQTREVSLDSLSGYKNMIMGSVNNPDTVKRDSWTSRQTYIALGFLLHTAAQLEIDSTPMEGFQNEKYDAILGLKELGLKSVVACALGYRHVDDMYQHKKKVRKAIDDLFIKK